MAAGAPHLAFAPRSALLRRLEWRVRHAAETGVGGEYKSAFRGRGREFDQVVRYEYGDDVRDIDWNVTARLGEPYRKKYVEERELTVVLLFEDTLSLQFGSGSRSKRELLCELAGLVALVSAGSRDRIGIAYAAPGRFELRPPLRGRAAILAAASELLSRDAPPLEALGRTEIDWQQLHTSFPRHAVVVWFSDFAPAVIPLGLAAARRRFELVGVRAEDPVERALPDLGALTVVDPVSGAIVPFDARSAATRRRHAEWREARDRFLHELFPAVESRLCVATDGDPLAALIGFFRRRAERLRR
jgi:uncharacterized protein (DUF58 family)